MKKIKYWFIVTFLNRKRAVVNEGGFEIVFRDYDMRIRTKSGNFSMKVMASEYPFGYLATALSQGKKGQVHGYAQYMYLVAMMICRDGQFKNDVKMALERMDKREQRKAEKQAKKVDESMEQVDTEIVKRDIEVGQMSRRERRKASREFHKTAKTVLNDEEEQR